MFCLVGKPCDAWRLDEFRLLAAPRLGTSRVRDTLRDMVRMARRGVTSKRAETSATEIESEDVSCESIATEAEATRLMVTVGCSLPASAASEDSLGRFSTRRTGAGAEEV